MKKIYYNGPILTMDPSYPSPEAVLIDTVSGVIEAVGSLAALENIAGTSVHKSDLVGCCLMPGFIDAHSHVTMAGQTAFYADLSKCRSHQEIVEVLKAFISARNLTGRDAAYGVGYDQNYLAEQKHPNRHILDMAAMDVPIVISHVSGHMACANTLALRQADITRDSCSPPGGLIEKDPVTGEPTGYLEETGIVGIRRLVQERLVFDDSAMLEGIHQLYFSHGITTAQEGAASKSGWDFLKKAADTEKLLLDVIAYPTLTEEGNAIFAANSDRDGICRKHLKLGGHKLILDGSPQARSAWMSEPYLGEPEGYCGYPRMTDDQVQELTQTAINNGRQLLAHCNGDAASEQFLTAYERALKNSENPNKDHLRPVMIHCQTVRNDQLERMEKISMIASIFIGHVWYWGDIHLKNFGPVRGHHISPARDALDRGITVTFHQDTPVTQPDMLHTIWCAVNRVSRQGVLIGPEQRISVYEALKAVTINAAFQYSEEDVKGSLTPGKRADLVILDRSPLPVPEMELREIRVLETIKDGKRVYAWEGGE